MQRIDKVSDLDYFKSLSIRPDAVTALHFNASGFYIFKDERLFFKLYEGNSEKLNLNETISYFFPGSPSHINAACFAKDHISLFRGEWVWRISSKSKLMRDYPKPLKDVFKGMSTPYETTSLIPLT